MHQVMKLAAGLTGEQQGSIADAAEALKSVDFEALLAADEADVSVAFSPIPHDGAFFEGIKSYRYMIYGISHTVYLTLFMPSYSENFIDQFIAGDINTRASLMITSNSWEGNLIVPFYAFVPFFFGTMSKFKISCFQYIY